MTHPLESGSAQRGRELLQLLQGFPSPGQWGLSNSHLSALRLFGCPLFIYIQGRVTSGQIFLLLRVEFNFKLFKMWMLKLVDSVSTNYRGSDCVMLELCNSLILPSLILFILILHSILGIKSLVSFYFFFLLFSSAEMEIYRHGPVSDLKMTFFFPKKFSL